MSRIISVVNSKGGVGKTTLTYNLSFAISEDNAGRCLLIDLDAQGSLSSTFVQDIYSLEHTLADILVNNEKPITDVITRTSFENTDLIPANLDLFKVSIHLAGEADAQYYLIDKLEEVKDRYSFIILDCPPNLGLETRMALVASEGLIIPLEAASYSVRSTGYIHEMVQKVRKRANPQLRILGYVINRYDMRRKLEQQYKQMLENNFGNKMFRTVIKNSVKYSECVALKQPITKYQPNSEQAQAFRDLAQEVMERLDEQERLYRAGAAGL
jgi:chromosome partitioning protein